MPGACMASSKEASKLHLAPQQDKAPRKSNAFKNRCWTFTENLVTSEALLALLALWLSIYLSIYLYLSLSLGLSGSLTGSAARASRSVVDEAAPETAQHGSALWP